MIETLVWPMFEHVFWSTCMVLAVFAVAAVGSEVESILSGGPKCWWLAHWLWFDLRVFFWGVVDGALHRGQDYEPYEVVHPVELRRREVRRLAWDLDLDPHDPSIDEAGSLEELDAIELRVFRDQERPHIHVVWRNQWPPQLFERDAGRYRSER